MIWEKFGHDTIRTKDGRFRINKRTKWGVTEYVLMQPRGDPKDRIWEFIAKGTTAESMKSEAQRQVQQCEDNSSGEAL